jgi:hypothetical protein
MGKYNKNKAQGQQERVDVKKPLSNNPFKQALKDVRIPGPSCLACGKEIDTRPGSSLPSPRGSRQTQRQGFLHTQCQQAAEEKFYKAEWSLSERSGRFLQTITVQHSLEVPVLDDDQIEQAITAFQNGEV